MAARHVIVALAIIEREGRWLVHRRLATDEFHGLWEFPGGKVHDGETIMDAAVRECREELGIVVAPMSSLDVVPCQISDGTLDIHPLRCRLVSGEPRPAAPVVGEVRWVDAVQLPSLAMPPANASIIAELLRQHRA